MLKPHLYIHAHTNPDGSSWSAWACEGLGMIAFGYTHEEAYMCWVSAVVAEAETVPSGAVVH